MTPSATGRKRSRLACQTCRDLKRRCDGAHPCGTCVRFEYDCIYQEGKSRKTRRHRGLEQPGQAQAIKPPTPVALRPSAQASPEDAVVSASAATPHNQTRSLEANSGSAFVRKLALRLDPKKNPRMHTFAWNAFLGSRQVKHIPVYHTITELLPLQRMQELAAIYFQKVDPTYGFIDRHEVARHIQLRWTTQIVQQAQDAVLCGIAALGFLFSQVQSDAVELDLVESARILLEQSMSMPASVTMIRAWLLRVVYLRIAGTHYGAWMASSMVMHMIEAAGLTIESPGESALPSTRQEVDAETARRIVLVAQHLNIWMSFDMGLTRVSFSNVATMAMPMSRPGDFTSEITELLPFSVELDPDRKPTAAELENALHTVLGLVHSIPPTVLAQCNLALCLCRRLRSMEVSLSDAILQQILVLTTNGIQAAQAILAARAPWHHMAYVPFQIVCVLLAIDTVSSISQLRDAMQCLKDISAVYNTKATDDALKTARSLVLLHQRGKEMFASALNDILKVYPSNAVEEVSQTSPPMSDGAEWMDMLPMDFSNLQYFDIEQFLSPGFFWNAGSNGLV
ncbi:C6 transcription factor [Pochonia chlamydosporia 170]|uniref:C6 transcription factor n=1 Tax=Pochonia chlamydosporia 170 TaxID=1380566 RepID=A0A179F4P0_METCM|nr:C6 transcription factor [Pochonia chlamydosporia 170]OAQ60375.1 C6 transcription factor [Pochonia chlamydosporia 170]